MFTFHEQAPVIQTKLHWYHQVYSFKQSSQNVLIIYLPRVPGYLRRLSYFCRWHNSGAHDFCKHNATYYRYRYISTPRYFGTSIVFQENCLDNCDRKLYHISTEPILFRFNIQCKQYYWALIGVGVFNRTDIIFIYW